MSKNQNYDEELLFTSMVESAFEFLNKALDEFKESPKFSTVHFAIAIELFLKSRLMKEHWSLLVEKTDNADRNAFFQGTSKTVNPEAAIQRLAKIACDPIPEEARKVFLAIAQHRNRMVHFVHGGTNGNPDEATAELEKVVAEQCQGWRQLQLLLEKNWSKHFAKFEQEIANVEFAMQKHRGYLQAKFESKTDTIKVHLTDGGKVKSCGTCGFASVLIEAITEAVSSASCLVCWYSGTIVDLDCPTPMCHQHFEFDSEQGPPAHCPSCNATIADWVPEALDTGEFVTKDNMMDHYDKNCPDCGGSHTVVEHFDGFICTECFEYSGEIGICGWCGEGQLGGVTDHSEYAGCEFCDGRAGWDKD